MTACRTLSTRGARDEATHPHERTEDGKPGETHHRPRDGADPRGDPGGLRQLDVQDNSGGGGTATASSNPANANNNAGGKRGGILKVVTNEDAEHLDPGLAYFTIDYEFTYASQRPLYSYLPNNQTTPVPDMAAGPPEISADNKTITVHIRHGVHFSPPVNREVTSSDVAYAIERGFNPHVANPYAGVYFSDIVGAAKANGGPIAGIKTPDKYTITLTLDKPIAGFVASALVLPLSAAVPKEYAAKFDAHAPSDYGNYLVATGPYMLKNNASGTVIGIGYQAGKQITLVRNPNWSAATDYRPAYLDGVDWSIGVTPEIAGREALTGSHIVEGDTPPASIVKLVYQTAPNQIFFSPGSGNRYVALNNAVAAVQQRQPAQGGVRRAQPPPDGSRPRGHARRPDRHPLHLPRHPRLRRGGR